MRTSLIWLLCAGGLCFACSSSDDSAAIDASIADGDGDGTGDGDGDSTPPSRPRVDGGRVLGDVVPPCDPYDPDACGAAQKCDLVIRRSPTEERFTIYTGCVEDRGGRGEGDPCEPFNGQRTPYETEGLFDAVHVDPCEQGLICAPDPDIRGLNSCQRSCQSGLYSQEGFRATTCEGEQEYCETIDPASPGPYREVCKATDACDPLDASSCNEGLVCVPRLASGGLWVVMECQRPVAEPVPVGELCARTDECEAGSICWGPARALPSDWSEDNLRCRRVCSLDAETIEPAVDAGLEGDAGMDDAGVADDAGVQVPADAGVPEGACPAGSQCRDISESGLDFSLIPAAFGQCE